MSPRAEVVDRGDPEMMSMLDPDTLDPEKHYRFCQHRQDNIGKRRSQGYEPVLRSVHEVRLLSEYEGEQQQSADDLIRVNDCILMMCDKTRFKERRNHVAALASARLDANEKSFKDKAAKKGVETVTGERTKGEPK